MNNIEILKAQYNLALAQVDERLQLPIQRYVDGLDKELSVLREKKDIDWLDGIFAELRAEIASYRVVVELIRRVENAYDSDGFYLNIPSALAEMEKALKNE